MAKRKPKPATVGERLEMKRANITLLTLRRTYNAEHRINAKKNDAAIRRAVKKERDRCSRIAKQAFNGDIDAGDGWVNIANGKEQA
jgi:uncharacterized protein YdaU (DUF1376 family)